MQARFRLTLDQCDFARGNSVLDIGCGPGRYSIALAQKGLAKLFESAGYPGIIIK